MMDSGSMTQVKAKTRPSAMTSVYSLVSSLLMAGRSVTRMRLSHFTWMLPSHPGTTRRTG